MEEKYYIHGINGPVISVRGGRGLPMMSLVYVGDQRLPGEVVGARGEFTTVQIYEDAGGLAAGQPVYPTGLPLQVMLGPGMIGNVYDGIARPLRRIEEQAGPLLPRASACRLWIWSGAGM